MSRPMDGTTAAPPVHLLPARVDGEGGSVDGERTDHHAVDGTMDNYLKLENAAYAHYKRDKCRFLLHFHLESHNRCEVKLRPTTWGSGIYFRPELCKDGTLRLIPHFITIKAKDGQPMKRSFPHATDPEHYAESPTPQRRKVQLVESPNIATYNDIVHCAPVFPDDMLEDEDIIDREREAFERKQGRYRGMYYDHGTFTRRVDFSLPTDATMSTWTVEFANEIQKYANARWADDLCSSSRKKMAADTAHAVMILGKYGMDATMPLLRMEHSW
ncbi:hypothetical protein EK21DRAFT_108176 [Setomelanomma holmii]|uniref:Uncharacterized protein n=1 Tax=Setomelanomma holmii TaxID=210430 RepID=A0A9P4HGH0_9PLEO|nr:hypothetical protein EK21DRAFT_108176 [Setomelanomma holmii]